MAEAQALEQKLKLQRVELTRQAHAIQTMEDKARAELYQVQVRACAGVWVLGVGGGFAPVPRVQALTELHGLQARRQAALLLPPKQTTLACAHARADPLHCCAMHTHADPLQLPRTHRPARRSSRPRLTVRPLSGAPPTWRATRASWRTWRRR